SRESPVASGEIDAEGNPASASAIDPETGRPARFAYPPNLVVVDGGEPQVAAAQQAMDAQGVEDVALIGLAKRLEEVWLPGETFPLVLPRTSPGLYLLQRLRDEAHRFALAAHRKRRTKAMTRSVLDDVPGLGPTRQRALLRHFGSVAKLRRASVEEIAAVKGVGPGTAQAVVEALQTPPASASSAPTPSAPSAD